MDRTQYPDLVKQIIREQADIKLAVGDIEIEVVEQDAIGHYELRYVGWDRYRRMDASVLHIDIKNGKIWVQHDGIPDGVTSELLEAGVPAQDIVLGFHPPSQRKLTPFATELSTGQKSQCLL